MIWTIILQSSSLAAKCNLKLWNMGGGGTSVIVFPTLGVDLSGRSLNTHHFLVTLLTAHCAFIHSCYINFSKRMNFTVVYANVCIFLVQPYYIAYRKLYSRTTDVRVALMWSEQKDNLEIQQNNVNVCSFLLTTTMADKWF